MELTAIDDPPRGVAAIQGFPWRRQLPAHSPILGGAVLRAALRGVSGGADSRDRLSALVAGHCAARRVTLVGSGTQALQAAIEIGFAARCQRHVGRVALPAFSCFDVASAAVGAGATIVTYDVDPTTLQPDYDSLARALAEGAQVVVVAGLYGVPIDWHSVESCVAPHGAIAIEDAAQGFGAACRGRPAGSAGALAVLSFGRGKGWTGGSGGAVLVHDPTLTPFAEAREDALLDEDRASRSVTSMLAQWMLGRPSLYAVPHALPWLALGTTRYREPRAPRRLHRVAADLLLASREAALDEARTRRRNARTLMHSLGASRHVTTIRQVPDCDAGHLRFPFLSSRFAADGDTRSRGARLGIVPSYPMTLGELPAVRSRLTSRRSTPGAQTLVRSLFTAPTHSMVTVRDLEQIAALLDS